MALHTATEIYGTCFDLLGVAGDVIMNMRRDAKKVFGEKIIEACIQFHMDRLEQPLRWRKPRRIFVNSMSDLFHEAVPDRFIADVFATIAATPWHTYQVLTKRPQRALELLGSGCMGGFEKAIEESMALVTDSDLVWPIPNLWLGVSVENQATACECIRLLLDTPAAVRWISAEPLLGPINLTAFEFWDIGDAIFHPLYPWVDVEGRGRAPYSRIDWVVAGGESGPQARPSHPAWFRSLREQCAAAGVPFFFKQWGAWGPVGPIYSDEDTPDHLDALECDDEGLRELHIAPSGSRWIARLDGQPPPGTWAMQKIGKHATGRLLDGIKHNEYPT